MIGYKKVYAECKNQYGSTNKHFVLKLDIIGAVVKCVGRRKLRTSKARVLEVYHVRRGNWMKFIPARVGALLTKSQQRHYVLRSMYDPSFVYRVGDIVYPTHKFDSDINEDCGHGIHFYMTKEEAAHH